MLLGLSFSEGDEGSVEGLSDSTSLGLSLGDDEEGSVDGLSDGALL